MNHEKPEKTALTLTAVMLLGVVVPSASEAELSTEEVTESISETEDAAENMTEAEDPELSGQVKATRTYSHFCIFRQFQPELTHWDKGTFASVPLKHSRRRSPSGTSL